MTAKTKKVMKLAAVAVCAAVAVAAVVLPQRLKDRGGEAPLSFQGMTLEETTTQGVKILSSEISPAEYADYGISPLAETAYTLTATVNEDATVKAVDWEVIWENGASEWATGKTVTDYVTVSQAGALTATVQCLQAFGERVLVSALSRDDPQVKATCSCDYQRQITAFSVHLESTLSECTIDIGNCTEGLNLGSLKWNVAYRSNVDVSLYSVGTLDSYFVGEAISISLSDEAAQKLQKNGYDPAGRGQLEINAHSVYQEFGEEELVKVFGTNASQAYTLYQALSRIFAECQNILKVTFRFKDNPRGTYETFDTYMDIDADSLFVPGKDVQLNGPSVKF